MAYTPRQFGMVPVPQPNIGNPMSAISDMMQIAGQVRQMKQEKEKDASTLAIKTALNESQGDYGMAGDSLAKQGRWEESERLKAAHAAREKERLATRNASTEKALLPFALVEGPDGTQTFDRNILTREFTAAGMTDRLPSLFEGLDKADTAAMNLKKAKMEFAKAGFEGLALSTRAAGSTPAALKLATEHAVANGFMKKADADRYLEAIGDDPKKVEALIGSLLGEKPPEARVLNDGDIMVGPDGQPLGPGNPRDAVAPTNFDAAILAADRAKDYAEVRRLTGLKRQAADAGRAPEKAAVTGVTPTQAAAAERWKLGELASLEAALRLGDLLPDEAEGKKLEIQNLYLAKLGKDPVTMLGPEWGGAPSSRDTRQVVPPPLGPSAATAAPTQPPTNAPSTPTRNANSPAQNTSRGAARRPIPGIPGAEAEFRDGKWVRVK